MLNPKAEYPVVYLWLEYLGIYLFPVFPILTVHITDDSDSF